MTLASSKNQGSLLLNEHGASHKISCKPVLVGSICLVLWLGSGETVLRNVFDGPNLEKCILFQTIICDFKYPISDLSEKAIPHFNNHSELEVASICISEKGYEYASVDSEK